MEGRRPATSGGVLDPLPSPFPTTSVLDLDMALIPIDVGSCDGHEHKQEMGVLDIAHVLVHK